jgi:hypothetical protein
MPHLAEHVAFFDCFPCIDEGAPSSASAATNITDLIISATVSTAPLFAGNFVFSER